MSCLFSQTAHPCSFQRQHAEVLLYKAVLYIGASNLIIDYVEALVSYLFFQFLLASQRIHVDSP